MQRSTFNTQRSTLNAQRSSEEENASKLAATRGRSGFQRFYGLGLQALGGLLVAQAGGFQVAAQGFGEVACCWGAVLVGSAEVEEGVAVAGEDEGAVTRAAVDVEVADWRAE